MTTPEEGGGEEDRGGQLSDTELQSATWRFIRSHFHDNGAYTLLNNQIDSFNDFIDKKIPDVIRGFNDIEVYHRYLHDRGEFEHVLRVTVDNPTICKPMISEKDGSTKVMMPNDARLRGLTYAGTLTVDLLIRALTYSPERGAHITESKRLTDVSLGKVPIMVRSRYCMLSQMAAKDPSMLADECANDRGGYFIVNGNEKVIITQDRIAENTTYVFQTPKAPYALVAEIRSVQDNRFAVPKTTTLKLTAKDTQFKRCIRVNLHHIKTDVPLFVLFRALGVEKDRDIARMVVHDLEDPVGRILTEELVGSMDEASGVTTTRAALDYLARHLHAHGQPRELCSQHGQRVAMVTSVLRKEFLPHTGAAFPAKALYLGLMVNKLLRCYKGLQDMDDRDSYVNKRLNTPGVCMANLFRQYYGKVVKEMRNAVQKEINSGAWRATRKFINVVNVHNVYKIVRSVIVEGGLRSGLSTGNWGPRSNNGRNGGGTVRAGVAQVLNRMSYLATVSHLRRVNAPMEKTGKLVHPRMLNSTQYGVICPHETPEGQSIGLVKNLSISCSVTVAACSDEVRARVLELGTVPFVDTATFDLAWFCRGGTKVFVNGDLVGVHFRPAELHDGMRALKRAGAVDVFTSVAWYVMRNEMHFSLEGGRCVRPLYIVDDHRVLRMDRAFLEAYTDARKTVLPRPTWTDLVLEDVRPEAEGPSPLRRATVEYLDVNEMNCLMVAMTPEELRGNRDGRVRYSHMEMHPSLMMGAMAGSIPFSDRNQAPRNTYQSAMGKQAIGVYATNYRHRFDTMGFVMNYPQRPLVSTHIARLINCDKALSGVNTIVAIACYTGFNQEDSVIINQSAVDRGLFGSTFYRSYREQKNKNHSSGEEEVFCRPDPATTKNLKPFRYDKVAQDGFVPENTFVESGDILVGKCMPQRSESGGGGVQHRDTSVVLKNNERGFVDRNAYNNRYFINCNGEGNGFCKVRTRAERVPTIGDKVSCYTAGHEVLTSGHGWVDVSELRAGVHHVATLVDDGRLVKYQAPTEVQEYEYGGKLCVLSSSECELRVTPEHRMMTLSSGDGRCVMRRAAEMLEARRPDWTFLRSAERGAGQAWDPEQGDPRGEALVWGHDRRALGLRVSRNDAVLHAMLPMKDALTLLGTLWTSATSVNPEETETPMRFRFSSAAAKLAVLRCARDNDPVLKFLHYEKTSGDVVLLHPRDSMEELFGQAGTVRQRLPCWVWSLPCDLCRLLVDAMLRGSSTFLPARSPADADDLQRLLLHAGREAGIRVNGGLCLVPPRFRGALRTSTQEFRGKVYCCTVPEGDGVIYVRRNGKPMWCGQSRHGQKGTTGMLYRQEDMPYTASGIVPDIIVNPHAIPSRMTCGQLVECIMGKACAHKGAFGDATPFNGVPTSDIAEALADCGLHRSGDEVLYNGRTGEQIPCAIMIGPTYYQRLKHMVDDKLHSRSNNGPVVMLTRQPAEGRARDGGLRLGEMETECNWAHGIMHFLKERFMECSDNYRLFVCKACGTPAVVNPDMNRWSCRRCPDSKGFAEIRIPYACKLLLQEIQTMNIGTRFITN